jgi:hypothetical protein
MFLVETKRYSDAGGSGFATTIADEISGRQWRVTAKTEKLALTEAKTLLDNLSIYDVQRLASGSDIKIPS